MPGLRLSCAVLVMALVLSACGGSDKKTSATPTPTPRQAAAPTAGDPVAALEARFVDVVDRVSPKVVLIETDHGLGSGVVFDDHVQVATSVDGSSVVIAAWRRAARASSCATATAASARPR